MPRNLSGQYILPDPETPFISRTTISSTDMNVVMDDIETEIANSLDRGGRGAMTAPLVVQTGSAAAPTLTFSGDTDTGIYAAAANTLGFATGGAVRATLASGQLLTIDGALATPALSFISDPNTGIYRAGADDLRIVANGIAIATATTKLSVAAATAATGGTRQDALSLTNGDLDLSGVAAPTTTTAISNRLTPANIPKAWARVNLTGGSGGNFTISLVSGFNIASVARTSPDAFTITFGSAFASGNYIVFGFFNSNATGYILGSTTFNAGSFVGGLILSGAVGAVDLDASTTINSSLHLVFYGLQ